MLEGPVLWFVAGTVSLGADCNGNGIPDEHEVAPHLQFLLAPSIPVGGSPESLAAGDLDGDADTDLAVATPGGLRIATREATGGFVVRELPGFSRPAAVAAADLDGDGDVDLAATDGARTIFDHGLVSIILNDAGGLRVAFDLRITTGPGALVLPDLDGDGDNDLAVACPSRALVAILRNQGGSFAPPLDVSLGEAPAALAAADMDQDGRRDVVVVLETAITLIAEDSSGWLTAGRRFEGVENAGAIAAADLSGDGIPDLAVAERELGLVRVLQNNAGGLSQGVNIAPPGVTAVIAAADLDGDGQADLAVASERPSAVTLFPSRGPLAFATPMSYGVGGAPTALAAADFNGDGDLDLAAAVRDSREISILDNEGGGRLAAPWLFPVEEGGVAATATAAPAGQTQPLDLDGDGRVDLAAIGAAECMQILLDGAGRPRTLLRSPAPAGARDLAAADLDGDVFPDLAVAGFGVLERRLPGALAVLLNEGTGGLRSDRLLSVGVSVLAVAAGDLDGDADIDLASTSWGSGLSVWENPGNGAFARRRQVLDRGNLWDVAAADVDGGGRLELIAAQPFSSMLSVFPALGGGVFGEPQELPADGPRILIPRDFDGDGAVDLAVGGASASLFWNRQGRFDQAAALIPAPDASAGPLAALDVDGDGSLDLVLLETEGGSVWVLHNRGRRLFSAREALRVDGGLSLFAGDLDGDGREDLGVAGTAGLTVFCNRSLAAASPDTNANGIPDECEGARFARGDPDASGARTLGDAVFLLLHLFAGGRTPPCARSADLDDGGALDLADAIFLLGYLFRGGQAPAEPFASCGLDGSPDALTCEEYPPCR